MVAAIILAAGRSTRMGRAKASLPDAGGLPFVVRLASAAHAAGARRVIVVGRGDDEQLRGVVQDSAVFFVTNPDPDRGQLSSLICGLNAAAAADDVNAIVVLPVDSPGISASVISALVRAAEGSEATIVRAVHRDAHGHPVLFKREVFDELRQADPSIGARAVVRADPARVLDVECDDPRVLLDIDTPDDYSRLLAGDRAAAARDRV